MDSTIVAAVDFDCVASLRRGIPSHERLVPVAEFTVLVSMCKAGRNRTERSYSGEMSFAGLNPIWNVI